VSDIATPDGDHGAGELERRTLAEVLRTVQQTPLPVPLQTRSCSLSASSIPKCWNGSLRSWSAAGTLGAHFYGRRGQAQPAPPDPATPAPLGLVEGPLTVLHLDAMEDEAASKQQADLLGAAALFGKSPYIGQSKSPRCWHLGRSGRVEWAKARWLHDWIIFRLGRVQEVVSGTPSTGHGVVSPS
jgi:hypothetical protein